MQAQHITWSTLEINAFWATVDRAGDCWPWRGYRLPKGYGRWRHILAHRIAWMLTHGPIPVGFHVLHHCDHPWCCNPEHLWLGTNRDNIADRVNKGRSPRGAIHWTARDPLRVATGERVHGARLTTAMVTAIRREYVPRKVTVYMLADQYGTTPGHVSNIVRRKTWKHLP